MKPRFVAFLILTALVGCHGDSSPAAYAPVAGDRVTPELFLVEPWLAGEKAQVTVRLQLEGNSHIQPAFVRFEDVPEESAPTATVIFWKDQQEIAHYDDLLLKRDC
ncbi:MAG: hypothetical protein HY040_05820 [Planctomycetes bacterium]|nr:hypothetical protein [Planctomycetota bacterium]